MRISEITRDTNETKIKMMLNLDGNGSGEISTKCGFLDHMLSLFARHGDFDLTLDCDGDIGVDAHHTAEDTAITLGRAFSQALGDKRGICRYGSFAMPMDETLVLCAVDISGRSYLNFDVDIPAPRVGTFDTELAKEFFTAFAREANVTLHFKELAGENSHHIIEACFKAFARALKAAVAFDAKHKNEIPSTKGVL